MYSQPRCTQQAFHLHLSTFFLFAHYLVCPCVSSSPRSLALSGKTQLATKDYHQPCGRVHTFETGVWNTTTQAMNETTITAVRKRNPKMITMARGMEKLVTRIPAPWLTDQSGANDFGTCLCTHGLFHNMDRLLSTGTSH